MSHKQENVIREKRTIEATKKNLMGPAGKLGVILQAFGTPIIRQGSSMYEQSFMEDPYGDFVPTDYSPMLSEQQGPVIQRDEIPVYSGDFTHNEGLLFDGLSRGMHLEIVYWHNENKLKASYKGYPVYLEIAGELEGYAPFEEWESLVERLFKAAHSKMKGVKKQREEEIAEQVQKRKQNFWELIRARWGV